MSKVEALLGLVQSRDDVAVVRKLLLKLATKGGFSSEGSANWTEARLGDLGKWGSGGTPLRSQGNYYAGGTIPWLVIGDLNDAIVTKAATFITPEGLENSSASLLPENTLLIAMYGSIGKMGITGIQCATNQAIAHCKPTPEKVTLWYLFYALKSIQEDLLGRGQGLAQKNISQTILKAWTIPLPPLAEQRRIVAKVDELMALCDRLEAQLKERDVKQAALAKAALAKFTEDPTQENLELLFHPSFTIEPEALRKSILTLAVQGKLCPQDLNEEPAEQLLARLMKRDTKETGRRKKTQPDLTFTPDEIPYKLPHGWAWERLGNIGETNVGLTYSPQDISDVGIPVLRSSNVQNGKLDFDDLVRVKCEPKQSVMVKDGDLLICARNGSKALVGKVAVIEGLKEPAAFGAFMAIYRSEVNQYLYHFIRSPLFRKMIDEVNTTTINQITQNNLRSTLAPIPPYAEQLRIVEKVGQLMTLVEALERQLEASRTTGEKLLEAMVAELTAD